jgi:hypothetical protein
MKALISALGLLLASPLVHGGDYVEPEISTHGSPAKRRASCVA